MKSSENFTLGAPLSKISAGPSLHRLSSLNTLGDSFLSSEKSHQEISLLILPQWILGCTLTKKKTGCLSAGIFPLLYEIEGGNCGFDKNIAIPVSGINQPFMFQS